MKRITILLTALVLSLSASVQAEQQTDPVQVEMKALAAKGLTEALKLVEKSSGFYPFSIIYSGPGPLKVGGYTGDMDARPPAEEYVVGMLVALRKTALETASVSSIAIVKPQTFTLENGEKLSGVWVLVDHRDAKPWIVFQPLIPSDKPGHFSLGKQIIDASSDWIFEPKK